MSEGPGDEARDAADDTRATEPSVPRPEFGPSGYLPERASRRARKIILRAPMGIHWVVASLAAGLVVLAAGILLLARDTAPGPPFERYAPVEELAVSAYDPGLDAFVVVAGGRVEAFTTPDGAADLVWCVASRTIETADRVWNLTGRALDGGASLLRHPVAVTGGVVYVDTTTTVAGPPPRDEGATPTCA